MTTREVVAQHCNDVVEEWGVIKAEMERDIRTGSVEPAHFRTIDRFEEKLLAVELEDHLGNTALKRVSGEAEKLRGKIRRRLRHEQTVSGIAVQKILAG